MSRLVASAVITVVLAFLGALHLAGAAAAEASPSNTVTTHFQREFSGEPAPALASSGTGIEDQATVDAPQETTIPVSPDAGEIIGSTFPTSPPIVDPVGPDTENPAGPQPAPGGFDKAPQSSEPIDPPAEPTPSPDQTIPEPEPTPDATEPIPEPEPVVEPVVTPEPVPEPEPIVEPEPNIDPDIPAPDTDPEPISPIIGEPATQAPDPTEPEIELPEAQPSHPDAPLAPDLAADIPIQNGMPAAPTEVATASSSIFAAPADPADPPPRASSVTIDDVAPARDSVGPVIESAPEPSRPPPAKRSIVSRSHASGGLASVLTAAPGGSGSSAQSGGSSVASAALGEAGLDAPPLFLLVPLSTIKDFFLSIAFPPLIPPA